MKKTLKTAARGTVFPYAGEKWVVLEHDPAGRTLCLRPACYLDSDLLILVDGEDTGIGPQEAGTIVAELVEQFGGTYATGEQFTAEISFLLGKLRALREAEVAHE